MNNLTGSQLYRFEGTSGSVDLTGCSDVAGFFPALFRHWPYAQEPGPVENSAPILQVRQLNGQYHLSSPVFDTDQYLKDPLNIACSLLAELAWARLQHRPDMLCFHGAAVEVNGALVLLPNKRRAGKSTLVACLAAMGMRVFTDDYLPIELGDDGVFYGHANGAAPRLRLPLPEEFSPGLVQKLESMRTVSNKQYTYLDPPDDLLAHHGERLPISTIVMLERQDGAETTLTPAKPADILLRVILQNFSRHMNPARILGMIGHLVTHVHGLALNYASAEEAAICLKEILDKTEAFDAAAAYGDMPSLVSPALSEKPPLPFAPHKRYRQEKAVLELDYEQDSFLASQIGIRISHLDQIARAVWTVLAEPATLDDVTQMFQAAFPDQDETRLRADIERTMKAFAANNLITPADVG